MKDYYARLADLEMRLERTGLTELADDLRAAIRGSSTSREALSETARVLARILVAPNVDLDTRSEAKLADDHGQALWEGRDPESVRPDQRNARWGA